MSNFDIRPHLKGVYSLANQAFLILEHAKNYRIFTFASCIGAVLTNYQSNLTACLWCTYQFDMPVHKLA